VHDWTLSGEKNENGYDSEILPTVLRNVKCFEIRTPLDEKGYDIEKDALSRDMVSPCRMMVYGFWSLEAFVVVSSSFGGLSIFFGREYNFEVRAKETP
jgi:hypothetical protein